MVLSMPLDQPHFFPFFSTLLFTLLLAPPTTAQYLYTYCNFTKSGNYTQNTTYQSNLNALLPSLPANASRSSGFYYTSSGSNSNKINGLALCRGDVDAETCRDCLQAAQERMKQNCAYKKAAIIWYDYCMLRYADTNFSFFEDNFKLYMKNTENVTDPERLSKVLGGFMPRLVSEAVGVHPDKPLFAIDEVWFDDLQNLYGLVQCTRDLSKSDCGTCLENLIADIPTRFEGSRGARIIAPNCNFRYEFYRFFNSSSVIARPPSISLPIINPSMRNTTSEGKNRNSRRRKIVLFTVFSAVAVFVIVVVLIITWASYRKKKKGMLLPAGVTKETSNSDHWSKFTLSTIISATKNFAVENKLGDGGFGTVYKGNLARGQEIAVKRLSGGSGQGVQDFINEVSIVAKLQHRNLVRLLGCCADGGEQILVYEYVPNKSLDHILFDEKEKMVLNWTTRYKIMRGIARGLLYLHEDSRIKIIHRDLKASNVLLDSEMNSKIADFGLAKIIGSDQTHGKTDRIAGTYGYMAPEYVFGGAFSVKSDVYSFGVLLIEILTGQKNSNYYESQSSEALLSHVWKQWNRGTVMNIIDKSVREECISAEACKCVHIALLCLQEDAHQRPTMSMVNLMLNSNSVNLPAPLSPAFFLGGNMTNMITTSDSWKGVAPDHSTSSQRCVSYNEVTMTELDPR